MTPVACDLLDVARLRADQLGRLLSKLPPGTLGDDQEECRQAAANIWAVLDRAMKGGQSNG